MKKKNLLRLLPVVLLLAALILGSIWLLKGHTVAVLSPRGTIASQQRDLMNLAGLLSLIVVIPVFILTFTIAWKYRASNSHAKYSPNWDHNRWLETAWWGIPCVIILILAVITWKSSHDLDPYKPLVSAQQPVKVQVVALQWKWLFIYPEQNIATVNYLQIPEKRPIDFQITADAPMNSFWIPQLGGQVYAMSGMSTQLHLMADSPGSFRGSSANISGEGFAGMTFTAKATSQADFDGWVAAVKKDSPRLTGDLYDTLALPSKSDKPTTYSASEPGLYDTIVMKYMGMGNNHGH